MDWDGLTHDLSCLFPDESGFKVFPFPKDMQSHPNTKGNLVRCNTQEHENKPINQYQHKESNHDTTRTRQSTEVKG